MAEQHAGSTDEANRKRRVSEMTANKMISSLVDKFEAFFPSKGNDVFFAVDAEGRRWTLEVCPEDSQLQIWRSEGGQEVESCDQEATNTSELLKVFGWLKMAASK